MKKSVVLIALFFGLILVLPYVSAGLFDWLSDVMFAPSDTTNITVQVGNVAPVITSVQPVTITLSAGTSVAVLFNITATDSNGLGTLDDAAAFARLTRAGEIERNGSCTLVATGVEKTYQCSVTMWYYDDFGVWDVNATINDTSGALAVNDTSTQTVSQLRDILLVPEVVSFPVTAPGGTMYQSSVDTEITNQGNWEVPLDGGLNVTAYNLTGETVSTEYIPADNFNISGSSASATVCTTGVGGTSMSDEVSVGISGASLARGATLNTENITYCLTVVPGGLSTQGYTAGGTQSWLFQI